MLRRAALEVEVMLKWAATAQVPNGATVVMGLPPEDLAGFEKNWTATKWGVCAGVGVSENTGCGARVGGE